MSINLSFLLYLSSGEKSNAVLRQTQQVLGCTFRGMDTEGAETGAIEDYESHALGMLITLQWVHQWPAENIYRLSGGTISRAWAEDGQMVFLDEYVARVIASPAIRRVMSRQEYAAYRTDMETH